MSINFDSRTISEKSSDILSMVCKDLVYGFKIIHNELKTQDDFYNKYTTIQRDQFEWKNNKGLILLIHGLFGHPSHWLSHIEEIQNNSNEFLIKAPLVFKRGNCSLEAAAKPILELVQDYLDDNPGKPICILSASNGARISNYIDINLRNYPVDLIISTIAGAHLGSTKMNLINQIPIVRSLFDERLRGELSYQSQLTQIMVEEMKKKIEQGSRKYSFFATREDCLVTPFTSSLPQLDHKEKFFLLQGEGHGSIPNRVKKTQIQLCLKQLYSVIIRK